MEPTINPQNPLAAAAIIIPCVRVDALARRCLDHVRRYYPDAEIHLLADGVDGGWQPPVGLELAVTGPISIAAKRNLAAQKTRRPFLALIDSDAYPEPQWLPRALAHLMGDASLAAVGGPNISPPEQTPSERIVGLAMTSTLVSGGGAFRKMRSPSRQMDDHLPSCNLIIRREDWMAVGGMDEALFAGEDRDICEKFLERGRGIFFAEDVVVYHKNRDLRAFIAHRFRYGATLLPIFKKARTRRGWQKRYLPLLLPSGFILFLLTGPLAAIYPTWGMIYGGTLLLYLGAIILEALRLAQSPRDIPALLLALLAGNLVPGIGVLGIALKPDLDLGALLLRTEPGR